MLINFYQRKKESGLWTRYQNSKFPIYLDRNRIIDFTIQIFKSDIQFQTLLTRGWSFGLSSPICLGQFKIGSYIHVNFKIIADYFLFIKSINSITRSGKYQTIKSILNTTTRNFYSLYPYPTLTNSKYEYHLTIGKSSKVWIKWVFH